MINVVDKSLYLFFLTEFHLKKMWPSPNGTIRNILGMRISRKIMRPISFDYTKYLSLYLNIFLFLQAARFSASQSCARQFRDWFQDGLRLSSSAVTLSVTSTKRPTLLCPRPVKWRLSTRRLTDRRPSPITFTTSKREASLWECTTLTNRSELLLTPASRQGSGGFNNQMHLNFGFKLIHFYLVNFRWHYPRNGRCTCPRRTLS